jgi:hypothetical protein
LNKKKEESFYPEVSEKFQKYLSSYLPEDAKIAYSYNKFLPQMIAEINSNLPNPLDHPNYIPNLKLDILFAVQLGTKSFLILLEVKYLKQMGLSEYSQLSGYLQVAKFIPCGILLLVAKPQTMNPISKNLDEIIKSQNLPMSWEMIVRSLSSNATFDHQTGIACFTPNNGIDWVNTKDILGLSSFEALAQKIIHF